MAFDNLKFAREVNNQRKRLIDSAKSRGININDNATLSESVDSNIVRTDNFVPNYHKVIYIDIDGTILKEDYVEEGKSSTPPENPNYDPEYLVFDRWTYIPEQVVEDIVVSAMYDTLDGAIYCFYQFGSSDSLSITISCNYPCLIDWGDGSDLTQTADSTYVSASHTFPAYGNYIVKISKATDKDIMVYTFNKNKFLYKCYIGSQCTSSSNILNLFLACSRLEVVSFPVKFSNDTGDLSPFNNGCFRETKSLKSVAINVKKITGGFAQSSNIQYIASLQPIEIVGDSSFSGSLIEYFPFSSVKSIGSSSFNSSKLKKVNINSNTVFDGQNFPFDTIDTLEYININQTHTYTSGLNFTPFEGERLKFFNMKNCTFQGTTFLPATMLNIKEFIMPRVAKLTNGYQYLNFSNIGSSSSSYPRFHTVTFKKLVLPPNLTSIGTYFCYVCQNLKEVLLFSNSVPTLGSNCFSTIPIGCTFYVKDELLESYKSATNWSKFADIMRPISEYEGDIDIYD